MGESSVHVVDVCTSCTSCVLQNSAWESPLHKLWECQVIGVLGANQLDTRVADVNNDGAVGSTDALTILRFSIGVIDHF